MMLLQEVRQSQSTRESEVRLPLNTLSLLLDREETGDGRFQWRSRFS
jgi:hypothetical protein